MLKVQERDLWDNKQEFWGYEKETFKDMLEHTEKLGLVIEIGCGSGSWTKELCKEATEVVGVDFSKGLIKKTHQDLKKQNCHTILSDAEHLPFA